MDGEWLVVKCRSLLRKLRVPGRLDSYPFISGDAFRIRCGLDLTAKDFCELKAHDKEEFLSIFLPVGKFDNFLAWITEQDDTFQYWNLIIHNGDFAPVLSEMKKLSKYFSKVYAVNWMGPREIATPIPIGIENRILRRNGVPWEFEYLRRKNVAAWKQNSLLIAFKVGNNLGERGVLADKFRDTPGVMYLKNFLAPYKYKKIVKKSKFVLSPPGNGIDCHRTWEAIYLNSIPIVLSRAWPFKDVSLPVYVVEDWNELLGINLNSIGLDLIEPEVVWNSFMLQPFQKLL